MINIHNLTKTFENKLILNIINLYIERGDRVAIIGPSGCGKSTLLKILTGLLNFEEGEIEIEPEKIKEIYKQFYQKLLEKRLPTNEDEERIEINRNKCIEIMQEVAKRKGIKPVDDEEYASMKNGLKRKKAPDKQGWRYEWVK